MIRLTEIEARVLGVLIEKALTQAGSYPLSLNSLTLGCNQLQNREPVVTYSETDVSAALATLRHKGLTSQAVPAPGARVNRFEHRAVEVFHWDRPEAAVMAELLLRGRQTAGELRTHAGRMTPFQDLESVTRVLRGLMSSERRFVEELPREPGRSANRFRQLLTTSDSELTHVASVVTRGFPETQSAGPDERTTVAHKASESNLPDGNDGLSARVQRLEARMAELDRQLSELCREIRKGIDAPPTGAV